MEPGRAAIEAARSYDGFMHDAVPIVDARRHEYFDVVCAGEPLRREATHPRALASASSVGLLNVTRILARSGTRVGLATVLEDDRDGRASVAEIATLGVDVGAVKLAPVHDDFVLFDAAGGRSSVVDARDPPPDLDLPSSWSSQVLLLSGVSAVTSSLATLCRAARRARRDGTIVVLDLVGSLRHWVGRDPRPISMVIREADVVRSSWLDLAALGLDGGAVRGAMRPSAVLVLNEDGRTTAKGAFGEVTVPTPAEWGLGEACTAAICAEYARPRRLTETADARWVRILRHEANALLHRSR
jgi:sugar/nucleoside kinase (ribokinase family)